MSYTVGIATCLSEDRSVQDIMSCQTEVMKKHLSVYEGNFLDVETHVHHISSDLCVLAPSEFTYLLTAGLDKYTGDAMAKHLASELVSQTKFEWINEKHMYLRKKIRSVCLQKCKYMSHHVCNNESSALTIVDVRIGSKGLLEQILVAKLQK